METESTEKEVRFDDLNNKCLRILIKKQLS